jgi:signal transduction histidine kinase
VAIASTAASKYRRLVQTHRRIGLWMLVSAPLVLTALGTVAFLAQWHFTGQPRRFDDLILTQSGWLVCAALAPAVFAASKRWPFSEARFVGRAALHMGCALLYWAAAGAIFQGIVPALFEWGGMLPGSAPSAWSEVAVRAFRWFVASLPFGAIIYFSIVGVEHALRYFGEARERDIQMSQLETRLTRARLSALQSQVNPHFLFNALNTIAVRARDGDGAATARIAEQLSEILRRTLSRDQSHEVTLAEELDVVQQYLAIEQARFSDRLQTVFNVDVDGAALGAAVPTLAVQHLVENAVRHGIARSPEGGRLVVTVRRDGDALEVQVTDNGPGIVPRSGSEAQQRGGISDTQERLRSLYGAAASLVVSRTGAYGTAATLRLPYREMALELSDVER